MKAASDNAKKVIGDLQLVHNKTRQAAITKEISEMGRRRRLRRGFPSQKLSSKEST